VGETGFGKALAAPLEAEAGIEVLQVRLRVHQLHGQAGALGLPNGPQDERAPIAPPAMRRKHGEALQLGYWCAVFAHCPPARHGNRLLPRVAHEVAALGVVLVEFLLRRAVLLLDEDAPANRLRRLPRSLALDGGDAKFWHSGGET